MALCTYLIMKMREKCKHGKNILSLTTIKYLRLTWDLILILQIYKICFLIYFYSDLYIVYSNIKMMKLMFEILSIRKYYGFSFRKINSQENICRSLAENQHNSYLKKIQKHQGFEHNLYNLHK